MSAKQCDAFDDLIGRLAGFLGVEPTDGALVSDALNLIERHGAPAAFIAEYQEHTARQVR